MTHDHQATTVLSLRPGETAVVTEVSGDQAFRDKVGAMGLHRGREVRMLPGAGSRGPLLIDVMGSTVALGRKMAGKIHVRAKGGRLLLTGNPNVGKSVVFSRLTGLDVISSNYPGTTVEFTSGTAWLGGERFQVIDVPGTYSVSPSCAAEEVACRIISENEGCLAVHVLDSTNLERNLFLALQLMDRRVPLVLLLNKWDVARLRGIAIDAAALSARLGVSAVPFVAVTGEGIKGLEKAIAAHRRGKAPEPARVPADDADKWKLIGEISRSVQTLSHKHPTFLEQLADLSVRPATGIPLAMATLAAAFFAIRTVGEGLINWVLEPLFRSVYLPLVLGGVDLLPAWPGARAMLVGTGADPMQSFGVLTMGVYVPFVAVLPYIVAFYMVLGYLEDLGYLPRLAVLLDRFLHRLGLHGYGAIPILLGLGCKVPALLAARVLETRRERVIAMTLALMLAPCMPQSAMILSQVGRFGLLYAALTFGVIAAVGTAAGVILHLFLKGDCPELFVEIPPYQLPRWDVLAGKLWLRVRSFLSEAVPMIVGGVAVVGLLDMAGFLRGISEAFRPFITGMLGLPPETASAMVLGFLRKDVSIAMLAPYQLSAGQSVTACVFLALYLPCMASFSVLVKEAGWRDAAAVTLLGLLVAGGAASALHLLGHL